MSHVLCYSIAEGRTEVLAFPTEEDVLDYMKYLFVSTGAINYLDEEEEEVLRSKWNTSSVREFADFVQDYVSPETFSVWFPVKAEALREKVAYPSRGMKSKTLIYSIVEVGETFGVQFSSEENVIAFIKKLLIETGGINDLDKITKNKLRKGWNTFTLSEFVSFVQEHIQTVNVSLAAVEAEDDIVSLPFPERTS